MIERYEVAEMKHIWSEDSKYYRWWQVEWAVLEECYKRKMISDLTWKKLKTKAATLEKKLAKGVLTEQFYAEEEKTRHDILAFVQIAARLLGEREGGRFLHLGLTSSDVLDTASALAVGQVSALFIQDIDQLLKTLKEKSLQYKTLPTIGRSHGMWAEPTSFGLKFRSWYEELSRVRATFVRASDEMRFGKISGPVGSGYPWGPSFEKAVLARLGLKREPVSTQVVPRDRYALWLQSVALGGAMLERMAIEVRHLSRSEVGEVSEPFAKGQKGSSAMPHKKNPISAENICGVARLLRSYAATSVENIALWHERDISHSSVERVILPDASHLFSYALRRMNKVMSGLVVNEERIRARAEESLLIGKGNCFSSRLLTELVLRGAGRQEAYEIIQTMAFDSSQKQDIILDKKMKKFFKTPKDLLALKKLFDPMLSLKFVDEIFKFKE